MALLAEICSAFRLADGFTGSPALSGPGSPEITDPRESNRSRDEMGENVSGCVFVQFI